MYRSLMCDSAPMNPSNGRQAGFTGGSFTNPRGQLVRYGGFGRLEHHIGGMVDHLKQGHVAQILIALAGQFTGR